MSDLQNTMLNNFITSSREYGLTLNVKKIKYMIVTKIEVPSEDLCVEGEKLERVERYDYLGTSIYCSVDYFSKIKICIEKARASFTRIKMEPGPKNSYAQMLCIPGSSVRCGDLDCERILRPKTGSLRDVDVP